MYIKLELETQGYIIDIVLVRILKSGQKILSAKKQKEWAKVEDKDASKLILCNFLKQNILSQCKISHLNMKYYELLKY